MRLSKTVVETLVAEYQSIQRQILEKEREAAQLKSEAGELRQTAESLRHILGEEHLPQEAGPAEMADGPTREDLEALSFRDALKRILAAHGLPMKSRDVTKYLLDVEYRFSAKTPPNQLVNNNLSAMAKRGDLVRSPEGYMLARPAT